MSKIDFNKEIDNIIETMHLKGYEEDKKDVLKGVFLIISTMPEIVMKRKQF